MPKAGTRWGGAFGRGPSRTRRRSNPGDGWDALLGASTIAASPNALEGTHVVGHFDLYRAGRLPRKDLRIRSLARSLRRGRLLWGSLTHRGGTAVPRERVETRDLHPSLFLSRGASPYLERSGLFACSQVNTSVPTVRLGWDWLGQRKAGFSRVLSERSLWGRHSHRVPPPGGPQVPGLLPLFCLAWLT